MDVLVVGDANPDLILAGDAVPRFGQAEQLLDRADLVLGGSASIMACGLARLGVATGLAAVVGEDVFGHLVRDRLTARGVDISGVVVDPRTPTGLSVLLLADDDRAILTLLGTVPGLEAGHVLARVETSAPQHVHVASYFLQPGLAAALPALLDQLRDLGVTISLDTNWDPAERWTGLVEVLRRVDILLPNRAEVLAIACALGVEVGDDVPAAARALAAYGCRVVVKCGAEGALSIGPDGSSASAAGLAVDVVDTTGAGDSFDAGYVAALVGGVIDEAERLRWATVAGALSVRAAGGTASQATRDELAPPPEAPLVSSRPRYWWGGT